MHECWDCSASRGDGVRDARDLVLDLRELLGDVATAVVGRRFRVRACRTPAMRSSNSSRSRRGINEAVATNAPWRITGQPLLGTRVIFPKSFSISSVERRVWFCSVSTFATFDSL